MDRDALWLWFTDVFGYSSVRTNRLLNKYGSIDGLLNIPEMLVMENEDFSMPQKKELIVRRFTGCERKIEALKNKGIKVISIDNPLYPQNLKEISNPPFVLYCMGNAKVLNAPCKITMVGTRKPDETGRRWAGKISGELSSMGAVIVSGLAEGCDRLSQEGALREGGATIGVCACGLLIDYPKGQGEFRKKIEEKGCVISEFPPTFPVRRTNFAIRNRILSGLSQATVVIQGTKTSGSLLTASDAVEQNRDLYVLTGDPFNPLSEGPLSLLNDGAAPFISSEGIMEEYMGRSVREETLKDDNDAPKEIFEGQKETLNEDRDNIPLPNYNIDELTADLDDDEKKIMSYLLKGPLQIDEIAERANLPSHRILSCLTELELFSYVQALPGGMYKALLQ